MRTIELIAASGYSIQALALLADAYESAHVVAYIGQDDARARAWEEHNDLKDTYPPRRDRRQAVRATLAAAHPYITDSARVTSLVEGQERIYTISCMAKHSNPILMGGHGIRTQGDVMTIIHGPVIDNVAVKRLRVAVFHASRLLVGATILFARPLIEPAPAIMNSFLPHIVRATRRISAIARHDVDHDLDAV